MIKRVCLFFAVLMAIMACTNFGQEVDEIVLEPNVKSLTFESSRGSFYISIKSGSEWDITVPYWIKLSSIASVPGSPFEWNVNGYYEENTTNEVRSGFITFKTKLKAETVSVSQKGLPVEPVRDISVYPTSCTITEGESVTLVATVSPSNATNKSVTWRSSNTSVATVDSNGTVGTVRGIKAGTATITVTTVDGGLTASCVVTVNPLISGDDPEGFDQSNGQW